MTHIGLIPILLTCKLNLVICNVSSQSPANLLYFWHNLSFTFFDLSMSLIVLLALVCLVIAKEQLKLLLAFLSFVKLLKFISLVLDGRALGVQVWLVTTDVVLKGVHVL